MTIHPMYTHATFLTSAAKISQLPADRGAEVAFAGRSNAGKSSALNVITHNKRLARTSKTPGRTQLINFFQLDEQRRLVDLPGYGYAKVPLEVKIRWQKTLAEYLQQRKSLKGVVLLMDIRHPFKPFDTQMLEWSIVNQLPLHILLTKADKLGYGATQTTLQQARKFLEKFTTDFSTPFEHPSIQLFSAFNSTGLKEVHTKLAQWLYAEEEKLEL